MELATLPKYKSHQRAMTTKPEEFIAIRVKRVVSLLKPEKKIIIFPASSESFQSHNEARFSTFYLRKFA